MHFRSLFNGCFFIVCSGCLLLPAAPLITPAPIPTLDEMAGDWQPLSVITNLTDVHNFNQMLVVNRDLTSYFCNPGGLFITRDRLTNQWQEGFPLVKLELDGVEYPAVDARWYPYRALRRNLDCGGLGVETDTRMINEKSGVLCRIVVTNPSKSSRDCQVTLKVPGMLIAAGPTVSNATQRHHFTTILAPSERPEKITSESDSILWHWTFHLSPGASKSIGFVSGQETDAKAAATGAEVADWASHFDEQMEGFRKVWQQRWTDAFTPGNSHFSGSLPVLETSDLDLKRNYYMGVMTMLVLERTQFPIARSFVTSGERGEGTQYFWDASMQSTAWALLEPEGMKSVLRRWLAQNPRGSPHISLRDSKGYDPKPYDVISGYAANACTIFQGADTYLRVTGDTKFLDEKLENGRTVLENMLRMAEDWKTLPKGPEGLVDYGSNGKLLETAPIYAGFVASVNAQNVWMMRRAAEWEDFKGLSSEATALRAEATNFLPAVLTLFNKDTGAWNLRQKTGATVPVQHCFDYIYCGNALSGDLTPAQRAAMNAFAVRELLTDHWMRAMSLKDPNAPRANRPDHGPNGAYDGWIPLTSGAMWRLGDPQTAVAFYDRTAAVTREGPFAQAHEFYGPEPTSNAASVRVALRGSNMKECISGAAFADVVIQSFFGYQPSCDGRTLLIDPGTPRPFSGTMTGVRHGSAYYSVTAGPTGLQLRPELTASE